jgi:hypothetical protein
MLFIKLDINAVRHARGNAVCALLLFTHRLVVSQSIHPRKRPSACATRKRQDFCVDSLVPRQIVFPGKFNAANFTWKRFFKRGVVDFHVRLEIVAIAEQFGTQFTAESPLFRFWNIYKPQWPVDAIRFL